MSLAGTTGSAWIVDGGLVDGDRVIVAGVQMAKPGAQVQAVEVAPATIANAASMPAAASGAAGAPPVAAVPVSRGR